MVEIYTIPASSEPSSFTANSVHYANSTANGAYYGWGTATAGTLGSSYSICPRGWRLPIIDEYTTLVGKKTGIWNSGWTLAGAFFPAAGSVGGFGSLSGVGSGGLYWSSTAGDNSSVYHLVFNSSNVFTSVAGRSLGFSVRCIAP